jgi:hypothetical protein
VSVHSSIVSFTEEDEEFAEKTAGTAGKNGKGALCIAKRRAGERPFRAEDQQRAGGFSLTGSARASSERPVRGVWSEPRASKKTLILRFD